MRLLTRARRAATKRYGDWAAERARQAAIERELAALRATAPELPSAEQVERLRQAYSDREEAAPAGLIVDALASLGAGDRLLECGSGLTTLVLGLYAAARGFTVVSLEQHAPWREVVAGMLDRHRITGVELRDAPLVERDGVEWYDFAPEPGTTYDVVVCDGPPAWQAGKELARYGLLPRLREAIGPDTLVLLDDAGRPGEQEVLRRWTDEFGAGVEVLADCGRFYARVRLG